MAISLFDPIALGTIEAPNRILMAPLTRGRATPDGVPTPLMQKYYTQRANAGLIISEGTGMSREGAGWPNAAGIWTDAQVEGWKPVVDAVHDAGGRIVVQLWHMGRMVHPVFLGGDLPVSASATCAPGDAHTPAGRLPYVAARPLGLEEIPRLIDDYALAAENALKAGFDGVQLHAANGYLIDQFLRDSSNLRDDDYGGSPANRARLLGEVSARLVDVWGKGRVSVRLSPNGDSQGVDDSNPGATFAEAARVLESVGIGFLELRQPGPEGTFGATDVPPQDAVIRSIYTGPLVLNSDYSPQSAAVDVASGRADAISFGRAYISNPDLALRLRDGVELAPNKDAPDTWYLPGERGYTDYPTSAEQTATAG